MSFPNVRVTRLDVARIARSMSPLPEPPRSVDSQLLRLLADDQPRCMAELTRSLGVTTTAVRQRLRRLLSAGLISRQPVVGGRGRPAYRYRLTDQGRCCIGADPGDLAEAMWQAILSVEDVEIRSELLRSIAERLGRDYAADVPAESSASLSERMRELGYLLARRRIVTRVAEAGDDPDGVSDDRDHAVGRGGVRGAGGLPVLDVPTCPYPTLRDATDDRLMCQLETRMFSRALGRPVRLSSCILDGAAVCRFVPLSLSDSQEVDFHATDRR